MQGRMRILIFTFLVLRLHLGGMISRTAVHRDQKMLIHARRDLHVLTPFNLVDH